LSFEGNSTFQDKITSDLGAIFYNIYNERALIGIMATNSKVIAFVEERL